MKVTFVVAILTIFALTVLYFIAQPQHTNQTQAAIQQTHVHS